VAKAEAEVVADSATGVEGLTGVADTMGTMGKITRYLKAMHSHLVASAGSAYALAIG
jgi:hypothetical protein